MAKAEKQKQKLLYLIRFLQEKSHEERPLKMDEILALLDKEGIRAERKSIYNDIEELRDFGYDIVLVKGKKGGYFLANREFESAELKVLIDAVQASRFITAKKSKELIKKITGLAGEYEAKHLNREVYVVNRIKSENEGIFYNVDEIHRAIERNSRISFRYLEYAVNKEIHYRRDGKVYEVSPWALTWNDENYYLIAYDEEADQMKHYRVDKIKQIALTEVPRVIGEEYKNFDVASYCNQIFGMYAGETQNITIRFPNRLIGVAIDRFGKDITVHSKDKNSFTMRTKVSVSPQLFGWITGLGPKVRIVNPPEVVEQYRSYIADIAKTYENI